MIVFAQNTGSRLVYTLDFVLKEQLGLSYELTSSYERFKKSKQPKINYSVLFFSDALNIKPYRLLSTHLIQEVEEDALGEDIFAFVFYMLSRYEEYTDKNRDKHGRFSAKQSLLYRLKKQEYPVVDILILNLGKTLKSKFPEVEIKTNKFKKQPTIDIDQVFKYKEKSLLRNLGGALKHWREEGVEKTKDRMLVSLNVKKDPWDLESMDWLSSIKRILGEDIEPPILFFLLADYSKYDKNISPDNPVFQKRIKKMSDKYKVGIHPSYFSHKSLQKLVQEKNRLEKITEKTVTKSRQHYIKLQLPQTYRNLIKIGIKEDYSMGFADSVGFRAGTSHSFWWYDLEKEQTTDLRIHPFCAMDVTLKNYMKLSPEKAKNKIEKLKQKVKENGGVFCVIFHNESLSGRGEWSNYFL